MIVVDTSVWVEALRKGAGETAKTLTALLDADEVALPLPVRVELLSGVSTKDRNNLSLALKGLPVIVPTDETWALIESWTGVAARAGFHFSVTDLLIGALSQDVGGLVWSLDADFSRMAEAGLVGLYG